MRDSEFQDFQFELRGEQWILACFRPQFQLKKNPLVRHSTTPKYLEEKHFWTEVLGEKAKERKSLGSVPPGQARPMIAVLAIEPRRVMLPAGNDPNNKETADSIPGVQLRPRKKALAELFVNSRVSARRNRSRLKPFLPWPAQLPPPNKICDL